MVFGSPVLQVVGHNFGNMPDLDPAVSLIHSPAKLKHAARAVGDQDIGPCGFNMIQFLAQDFG